MAEKGEFASLNFVVEKDNVSVRSHFCLLGWKLDIVLGTASPLVAGRTTRVSTMTQGAITNLAIIHGDVLNPYQVKLRSTLEIATLGSGEQNTFMWVAWIAVESMVAMNQ